MYCKMCEEILVRSDLYEWYIFHSPKCYLSKILNRSLIVKDRGWIMSESFVPNRAPNCEEECVSIHYIRGSDVERLYQSLYVNWEARQNAISNSTNSNKFNTPR
jgi:hypothetical protein